MSESKKSSEQVEQERFTRRQALRKFGFGAGLSAFMLLGVDDLARMVGQRMQQMEGDRKVADRLAKEFQSAGIALANSPSGSPSDACPPLFCDCIQVPPPPGWTEEQWMQHCISVNNAPSVCVCY